MALPAILAGVASAATAANQVKNLVSGRKIPPRDGSNIKHVNELECYNMIVAAMQDQFQRPEKRRGG